MPHNGSVIISCLIEGEGYKFEKLVERMVASNSFRNAYPYNRVGYYSLDGMAAFTTPTKTIYLPRVGTDEMSETFTFVEIVSDEKKRTYCLECTGA